MYLMNRDFVDYVCASIKHQHTQYRHGIDSPEFLATYEVIGGLSDRLSSEDRIEAMKISLGPVHEMAHRGTKPAPAEPPK